MMGVIPLEQTTANTLATSGPGIKLDEASSISTKNVTDVSLGNILSQSIAYDPEAQKLASLVLRTGTVPTNPQTLPAQVAPWVRDPMICYELDGPSLRQDLDVEAWLRGEPLIGQKTVTPEDIVERFRLLSTNLDAYVEYLMKNDPQFANEIRNRAKGLAGAQGPGDIDLALTQIKRNTAGLLGEKMVIDALKPFFDNVELQKRVQIGEDFTKIDFYASGAKSPLVFGKGLAVPKGGVLAIEVKTGQASALSGQAPHIVKQIEGHHNAGADASLVITTKDVYDILGQGEGNLRDTIRQSGSRLVAFLPSKNQLDSACRKLVIQTAGGSA